jgi:hypothetical protein
VNSTPPRTPIPTVTSTPTPISNADGRKTGKEGDSNVNGVIVVPNPASNQAVVMANLPWPGNLTVDVLDLSGVPVVHKDYGDQNAGAFEGYLALGNLSSGLYFVQVRETSGVVTQKVGTFKLAVVH